MRCKKAVSDLKPDVTIICSPNNPTGCVLSDEGLRALLESAGGLVVIDEAYHEFAEHSVVPLLVRTRECHCPANLLKGDGDGGLRAGYLLAAPQLVREIRKAVLPTT